MGQEKYNNYTNYETWLVGANLDNNEYHYNAILEAAKGIMISVDPADPDAVQRAIVVLSEWIKKYITPTQPVEDDPFDRLYSDLLTAAIGRVNFIELAEDKIDEIDPDFRVWSVEGREDDEIRG